MKESSDLGHKNLISKNSLKLTAAIYSNYTTLSFNENRIPNFQK